MVEEKDRQPCVLQRSSRLSYNFLSTQKKKRYTLLHPVTLCDTLWHPVSLKWRQPDVNLMTFFFFFISLFRFVFLNDVHSHGFPFTFLFFRVWHFICFLIFSFSLLVLKWINWYNNKLNNMNERSILGKETIRYSSN